MTEINAAELKKAVKELNETIVGQVEGVDKIRTVGISITDMAIQFINACNVVSEVDETMLSDSLVEVYNSLPDPESIVAEKPEKKAKAPKAVKEKAVKEPKAPKPPKEKKEKAPKKVVEKSRYGHVQAAKSGALDDMLFEGHTVKEMMEALEVTKHRVIGHANHLRDDFGLTLLIKTNEKDQLENHYKVKEKEYTPPTAAERKERAPKKEKVVKEVEEEEDDTTDSDDE